MTQSENINNQMHVWTSMFWTVCGIPYMSLWAVAEDCSILRVDRTLTAVWPQANDTMWQEHTRVYNLSAVITWKVVSSNLRTSQAPRRATPMIWA